MSASNSLLVNGSFHLNANGQLEGWSSATNQIEVWSNFDVGTPAPANNNIVELDANGGDDAHLDTLEQTVTTQAGQTYYLEFSLALRADFVKTYGIDATEATSGVQIRIGDALYAVTPTDDSWTRFSIAFTGTSSDKIAFSELAGQNDGVGALITNVTLTTTAPTDNPTALTPTTPPPPPPTDFLTNGSFQTDQVGFNIVDHLDGWTSATNQIEVWDNFNVGTPAPAGNNIVELDANGGDDVHLDTLEQTVTTQAGQTYYLEFSLSLRSDLKASVGIDAAQATSGVEIKIGDTVYAATPTDDTWTRFAIKFTGTGADKIAFSEVAGQNDGFGALLTNVTLTTTAPQDGATQLDPVAPADLITNGSFQAALGDGYTIVSSIDGWTSASNQIEVWHNFDVGTPAAAGDNIVELDAYGGATTQTLDTLEQTVTTQAGQTYYLEFSLALRADLVHKAGVAAAEATSGVEIKIGDTVYMATPTDATWTRYSIQFTGTGSDKIAFSEIDGQNDGEGALLTHVTLTSTPPTDNPAVLMPATPPPSVDLLTNGAFQTDQAGFNWVDHLDGWTSASHQIEVWNNFNVGTPPPAGKNIVELDADGAAGNPTLDTLEQTVKTQAGQTYDLQFSLALRKDIVDGLGLSGAEATSGVQVTVGNTTATFTPSSADWANFHLQFTGTGSDKIVFSELPGQNDGLGALLTDVSLHHLIAPVS